MKSSRQLVYDLLMRVFYQDAYSNIAFDQAVREAELTRENASFASALFYGVLERSIGLDASIARYLKKGISSLDKEVLVILRMGFYQLCFLDSVPDSAAVDETVRLAAYARKTSAKGLVNAVLRSFIRDGKKLSLPETGDLLSNWSIRYSCPRWILERMTRQYGESRAEGYARASLGRPPLYVRVNTLKTTPDKLIGWLEARGIAARRHEWLENCLLLEDTGSIDRIPQYRQGLFHVQDISSQLAVAALSPRPGGVMLDICSAPGSKSFTAAQYMENQGQIFAFDLYEQKLRRIREGAKRLGITLLEAAKRDGANPDGPLPAADCILCDVPCSGLGVIRRKPEIKYKPPQGLEGLPEIQYRILQNAAAALRPGGRLVYSTCTLNQEENEGIILRFLSQNNSFKPLQLPHIFSKIETIGNSMLTLFPEETGGDGFFIALLERA